MCRYLIVFALFGICNAALAGDKEQAICKDRGPGKAHCAAHIITDDAGNWKKLDPQISRGRGIYGPKDYNRIYNLSGKAPSGHPIVAVIVPSDNPSYATDLALFSSHWNIPQLPICAVPVAVSAVACIQKVDGNGGTNYPPYNQEWALESSLDVQAVHGTCQNCSILLVESNNMFDAQVAAIRLGAAVISNSWTGEEGPNDPQLDAYFDFPGVPIVFASGDSGYGASYPASSPYVVSVGGTSLATSSENAWGGSNSGCSLYEQKPSWQTDTRCATRTQNDVSAVADPYTGLGIYFQGSMYQAGGTSLSAPIIAGVFAQSGNIPPNIYSASLLYMRASSLRDVVSGTNGICGNYLCNAGVGFDGPTGLGVPKGTGAF